MKHFTSFAVAAAIAFGITTTARSQSVGNDGKRIGYNPLNNPQIRRQLNLSPQQVGQLRALNNSWRQQLQRLRRGAGNNLNSADQSKWNQMGLQYATMVSNVLTAEQQQTFSQLIAQLSTFSPNTLLRPMGPSAPTPNSSRGAGTASTNQTARADETAPKFRTHANFPIGPTRISISNQALGGGGSSAVGTAQVNGDPIGTNRPGPTQVQQGGGSSLFGTLLL